MTAGESTASRGRPGEGGPPSGRSRPTARRPQNTWRYPTARRPRNARQHPITGALAAGALTLTLAGCSEAGDLNIRNDGESDVTVRTGDEVVDVPGPGGVTMLDYGCTPGDVTVELPSGRQVVLPGPVCPDQEIVITDDSARLRPTTATTS